MAESVNNIEVGGKKGFEDVPNYNSISNGGDLKGSKKKDAQKTRLVEITADIMDTTEDNVYKVLRGRHQNDQIFACYMELLEGETKLIKSVKELVPFDI